MRLKDKSITELYALEKELRKEINLREKEIIKKKPVKTKQTDGGYSILTDYIMKSTCTICNSDKHSTNQHYADIMYNVEMTRK